MRLSHRSLRQKDFQAQARLWLDLEGLCSNLGSECAAAMG